MGLKISAIIQFHFKKTLFVIACYRLKHEQTHARIHERIDARHRRMWSEINPYCLAFTRYTSGLRNKGEDSHLHMNHAIIFPDALFLLCFKSLSILEYRALASSLCPVMRKREEISSRKISFSKN